MKQALNTLLNQSDLVTFQDCSRQQTDNLPAAAGQSGGPELLRRQQVLHTHRVRAVWGELHRDIVTCDILIISNHDHINISYKQTSPSQKRFWERVHCVFLLTQTSFVVIEHVFVEVEHYISR